MTSIDEAMTSTVHGIAQAQKSHCGVFMLRMSAVFMPKTDATNERGRKMIVTVVKTRMAASCRSLLDSMRWMFCPRDNVSLVIAASVALKHVFGAVDARKLPNWLLS